MGWKKFPPYLSSNRTFNYLIRGFTCELNRVEFSFLHKVFLHNVMDILENVTISNTLTNGVLSVIILVGAIIFEALPPLISSPSPAPVSTSYYVSML